MTEYQYIARNFNADTRPGGATSYGTVTGSDPLDTYDGLTSYVEASTSSQAVTWQLQPVGASAPDPSTWTAIRVEMWWQVEWIYGTGSGDASLYLEHGGGLYSFYPMQEYATDLGGGWWYADIDIASVPTPGLVANYVNGTFTFADDWWALAGVTQRFTKSNTVRASKFLLTIVAGDAARPLRLMQRGDGLGMGSGRVYAAGTRQNSTRVFGSP